MHPYISEVARDLERLRHLGMVWDAECDAVGAKQLEGRRHEPRIVPELERKSRVCRQHADEALQALQVEVKIGLELEQNRSEFVAESARRVDHQLDGLRLDGQSLDVGDVTASLDRKEETGRSLLAPGFKAFSRRLSIERVVELDRVEVLRVVGEGITRRQFLRIEALAPGGIRPPRTADPDVARH